MDRFLRQLQDDGVWIYHDARFDLAPNDWLEAVWTHWGGAIVKALTDSRTSYQVRLPIALRDGLSQNLTDLASGRVLPFTDVGYQEFLTLARSSPLKWTLPSAGLSFRVGSTRSLRCPHGTAGN
jgi:hypothetical protein